MTGLHPGWFSEHKRLAQATAPPFAWAYLMALFGPRPTPHVTCCLPPEAGKGGTPQRAWSRGYPFSPALSGLGARLLTCPPKAKTGPWSSPRGCGAGHTSPSVAVFLLCFLKLCQRACVLMRGETAHERARPTWRSRRNALSTSPPCQALGTRTPALHVLQRSGLRFELHSCHVGSGSPPTRPQASSKEGFPFSYMRAREDSSAET